MDSGTAFRSIEHTTKDRLEKRLNASPELMLQEALQAFNDDEYFRCLREKLITTCLHYGTTWQCSIRYPQTGRQPYCAGPGEAIGRNRERQKNFVQHAPNHACVADIRQARGLCAEFLHRAKTASRRGILHVPFSVDFGISFESNRLDSAPCMLQREARIQKPAQRRRGFMSFLLPYFTGGILGLYTWSPPEPAPLQAPSAPIRLARREIFREAVFLCSTPF